MNPIRTDRIAKTQAVKKDHREHDPDPNEQQYFEAMLLQRGSTYSDEAGHSISSLEQADGLVSSRGEQEATVDLSAKMIKKSLAGDFSNALEGMKVLQSWPEELHLRLLTGPMSGMEIHASLAAGRLALRLEIEDKQRCNKLRLAARRIEESLSDLFDFPIQLEVNYAPV